MITVIILLFSTILSCNAHTPDQTKSSATLIAHQLAAGYSTHNTAYLSTKKRSKLINHDEYNDNSAEAKRAIIIGASIGMGREMAKQLAADGYIVGMTARRINLLEELQAEIPTQTYISYMDVSDADDAVNRLTLLIEQMGGLDLCVIAATGFWDCDFDDNDWKKSLSVLTVDVIGFFALARTALNFFEDQGHGHLVGFSSVDGLRGVAAVQAYSASKAFCSRYLEAERNKFIQKNMPIFVTELCPGWVNSRREPIETPHAYWVETLDDAMHDIMEAIRNKEHVAYITKRWKKVADLLATIPTDLYNALSARPGGGF